MPDEAYGGPGATVAYQLVVQDELAKGRGACEHCRALRLPRTTSSTTAQKNRSNAGCPSLPVARLLAGIAMTEPGCGSDLKAIRTRARLRWRRDYVVDGAKTFITNGFSSEPAGGGGAHRRGWQSKGVSSAGARNRRPEGLSPSAGGWKNWGSTHRTPPSCSFDSVRVFRYRPVCWVSVEGKGFGQLMSQLHVRTPADRSARRRRRSSARWNSPSNTPSSRKAFRPGAWPISRTRASSWPSAPHWPTWCAALSMTASSACSTAHWMTKPPTWPSGGARSSRAKWLTSAFSFSAVMATWPNTRSHGFMPMHGFSAFTAAPLRS